MDNLLDNARHSLSSELLSGMDTRDTERIINPFEADKEGRGFPENSVVTSRFTPLNFLPKAFFEQFRRLANVYFVVIGIIALVGTYTSYYNTAVEPAGILFPMVVVVLISVIKDGIEDIKRHRTDRKIDALPARQVTREGHVQAISWKDLTVGSVILLLCDDEIPADVLVVACGGIQGPTAYVETAAIDGESNLKIKLPCYEAQFDEKRSAPAHSGNNEVSSPVESSTDKGYCPPSYHPSPGNNELEDDPDEDIITDYLNPSLRHQGAVGQAIAGIDEEKIRQSMVRVTSSDEPHQEHGGTRRRSVHDPSLILVSTDKSFVHGTKNILQAQYKTDTPSEFINAFNGSIIFRPELMNSKPVALSASNLLLRGSVLRATEWCVGIVTFTGPDTKLAMNSKRVPSKLSSLDRVVNKTLLIAIGAMVLICGISAVFGILWDYLHDDTTYLCLDENDQDSCESSSTNSTGLSIFTFATLYNNFVCISMYVSLEMVYLAQSYFITQDLELYDGSTNTPAEVHSSGLCADLGQVQYVLSDKTGTITKNLMKLRRCSVGGVKYGAPMPGIESVANLNLDEKQPSFSGTVVSEDITEQDWTDISNLSRFRDLPFGPEREALVNFLRVMVACNTVMLMPDSQTGELHVSGKESLEQCLQAESADEVALVTASVEYADVLLAHRDIKNILVKGLDAPRPDHSSKTPVNFKDWASKSSLTQTDIKRKHLTSRGGEEMYEILAVNVFDSERKRMSILLRMGKDVVLLCKGADNSILPLCLPNEYYERCIIHVEQFAASGLRTLVLAKRIIPENEAERWMGDYLAASNSLVNRSQMLARCAHEIEQNLTLVGAVGIEDELQDGVADAIEKLQETGLNVWMITGDKVETALAISRICGLIRSGMEVEKLIGLKGQALRRRIEAILELLKNSYMTPEEESSAETSSETNSRFLSEMRSTAVRLSSTLRWTGSYLGGTDAKPLQPEVKSSQESAKSIRSKKSSNKLVLAIDGASLEAIWSDNAIKAQFHKLAHLIPTVVACRVSPLQKASLVRLVKMGPGNPVTLAIGDGANDIGMIHEARIGVGISGREGKHAANSADFAIGQFRFVVPLLLIHGRYNYIRGSKLVLYSFFKNLVLVSTLFYYCNFSGFSGTVYLDSIVFSGFNFYLGIPIIILGIWDRDVSPASIFKYPKLSYQTGRLGELLLLSNFFRWCMSAFFQGMILFSVSIRIIAGSGNAGEGWNTNYKSIEIKNFHGRDGGIYVDGFFLYTCVVVCMQMKIAYMTTTWTWIHWVFWVLSTAGYLLFSWTFSQFEEIYDWYKVVDFTMGTGLFYLGILVVVWLLFMSDTVLRTTSSLFFPTAQDRLHSLVGDERQSSLDSDEGDRSKNLSNGGISLPERKTLSV